MLKGTTNRHVFLPPTVDWSVCNLEVLLAKSAAALLME